jgi:uncharacterized protein
MEGRGPASEIDQRGFAPSESHIAVGLGKRLRPKREEWRAIIVSLSVFFGAFLISCLAVRDTSVSGGSGLTIHWMVVALTVIFEFLDASAGMGFGTAITPMLLIMGFSPMQIIPVVMIQQAVAGLTGAWLHDRLGNVRWTFRPMSETLRLWIIIAASGCLAVIVSVTSVYGIFKLAEKWIRLYVAILLVAMGFVSLFHSRKNREYTPRRMVFFGALAGFNKGIGGGGYGPVVTIGGILSGIPVKSMMAITALSEGTVCFVSVIVWFALLGTGTPVDFVLLPSMMLGSMFAAVAAPYAVKVVPERFWKWFVPTYCCILAVYTLTKAFL